MKTRMEKFEFIQNSLNLKAVDLLQLTGIKFSTLRFERVNRCKIDDQLDDLVKKTKDKEFRKTIKNLVDGFPKEDRIFLLSQILGG